MNKKNNQYVVTAISAVLIAVLVLLPAFICQGCTNNEKNTELVGVWRYDEYTEYEFSQGDNGCLCLDGNTHYEFTYSIKDDELYIDFALDYVTDCKYTYSVDANTLTLVGGEGTAEVGKTYELTKVQ